MPARILVIEDDPNTRELMTYLLKAFGHQTLTAVDGVAGFALADAERPDLIVCDIHLPKMDGYAVARAFAGVPGLRDIPLIAVTALAMVGDREKILNTGFDGYLSKPIVPETFIAELDAYLPETLRARQVARAG